MVSAGGSCPASPVPPASAVSCQPAPVQGKPPARAQGRSSGGNSTDGLGTSKLPASADDAVVLPSMTVKPGTSARYSGKGAMTTADAKQLPLAEPQHESSEQAKAAATSTVVQLHIAAAQSQHAKSPPNSTTSEAAKTPAEPADCQPIACTLLVTSSNTNTAVSRVPSATTSQDAHLSGPLSGSLLPPLMPAILTTPPATNCSGLAAAVRITTPVTAPIGDTLVPAPDCSRQQVQRQWPSGTPVQESGSLDQASRPVVDTGKSETGRKVRTVVPAVDDISELELDVGTTTSTPACTVVTDDPAVTASWSRPSAVKRPSCEDVLALVLSPDAPAKKQKSTSAPASDQSAAGVSSALLSAAEHAMSYTADMAQLPAAAAGAAAAASLPATVSDAVSDASACTPALQVGRGALQASHWPDTACVSGGLHSSTAKPSLPLASNSIAAHTLPLPISLSSERGFRAAFKLPAQTQHPKQNPVTLFSSGVVTLKQGSISSKAATSGPGDIGKRSQCTGPAFAAYKPVIEELPSDCNQHIRLGSEEPGPAKLAQQPARVAGNDSDCRAAPEQYAVVAKPEHGVQQLTEDQAHQMQSSYQPAVQLVFDDDTSSEKGRHSSRTSGNNGHTKLAQQQQRSTADTLAGFAKHAVASDLGAIFSSFPAFEDMSDGEEEDDVPSAGMWTPSCMIAQTSAC